MMSPAEEKQVETAPAVAPAPVLKPVKSKTREWTESIIVALVLALIIRTFLVQAFKIPSGSMEDTLLIGDHLLVSKFIYGMQIPFTDKRILTFKHPQHGDVIVFEFPEDRDKSYFSRRDFIKRVVGVPGDVVEIREKKVFVNGKPYLLSQEVHKDATIYQPHSDCVQFPRLNLSPMALETCRDYLPPIKIPEGQYFVLGDNRDRSYDSRFWGFVTEPEIKGKAFIKYWSWDSERNLPRISRIGRLIN